MLTLPGCDALCEYGFGGSCGPCDPVGVHEAWNEAVLAPLLPSTDAIVCESDGNAQGKAEMSYWMPGTVHDVNVTVVRAAQEAGWARLEDNWYEDEDTSQMPKWSNLGKARGDRMRIDVKSEGKGARVTLSVEGVPPPPTLRGDATVFAYRRSSFALFDGHVALLPGVRGGVAAPLPEGFVFRTDRGRYARYGPAGEVIDLAPFPTADGEGELNAHGLGPRGMPWLSFNPADDGKPLILGELVGDAWDIEVVPEADPPLPRGTVDLARSGDGTIWALGGDVLYAKDAQGWHGTQLRSSIGPLRPLAAEPDALLVSTEDIVMRARLDEGQLTFARVADLPHYPELFDAGSIGVVARTHDQVVSILGDAVTPTGLPGEAEAPDLATNRHGVVAVATKNPSALLVRDATGTITRYPETGALPGRVMSIAVDPMGRVWTLMIDGDPFVADGGRIIPLAGLVGEAFQPSSITFLGNGAPPFLEVEEFG